MVGDPRGPRYGVTITDRMTSALADKTRGSPGPTAYQTIPRPAYIGLREAWDDRRVIETYKKKVCRRSRRNGGA